MLNFTLEALRLVTPARFLILIIAMIAGSELGDRSIIAFGLQPDSWGAFCLWELCFLATGLIADAALMFEIDKARTVGAE